MKAIRYERTGGPEVLEVVEMKAPTPGTGQVLVAVHTVGVNPVDLVLRQGQIMRPSLPAVPGLDISGTVLAVGEGVDPALVGQRVAGLADTGEHIRTALLAQQRVDGQEAPLQHYRQDLGNLIDTLARHRAGLHIRADHATR